MKKKIFRNTLFLSGSQIIGRIIGFLYFIFLARVLSVENFGIYAWVLGFGYNFYPLADFGLERLVLKEVPRKPKKTAEYLSKLLPLRLLLAIGSVFLSLVIALIMNVGWQKINYILVFGLGLLPYNLLYLYASIRNAQEKPTVFALATALTSFLSSSLGVLFIYLNLGLVWLFSVYFLANSVILALFIPKIKTWKIDFAFWKRSLKQSWVFALLFIFAVFYLRISLVLTGRLLGDYWAGIYGAASKFIEAGILIPQGLTLALFPLFSKLLLKDKTRLKSIYKKAILALFAFSLPIAITMILGSRFIIALIYGQDYLPAVPVFSLLGVLMIFLFINSLPGNIIQSSSKVKKFIPFAILNFVIALIAGLILIPKIGVVGGAWAMIIGEVFGLVINNCFVFNILNEKS